jgi:hypothetical protein
VSTGKFTAGRAKIEKKDNHILYRIAIPWRELAPLTPKPGTVFGLNFIIADNDGGGCREFWIGMAPGIAESKQPALYPKFVLEE